VFTLVRSVGEFASIFTICILVSITVRLDDLLAHIVLSVQVMYIYGIVGVNLFSGKYSLLLASERPELSFDTLPLAMIALFEWLAGQGNIMQRTHHIRIIHDVLHYRLEWRHVCLHLYHKFV
jgi:hypothetical protein